MHMKITLEVLARIKKRREELYISQDALASELGLERSTYTRKEKGIVPITLEEFFRIVKALNTTSLNLLSGNVPIEVKDIAFQPLMRTIPVINSAQCGKWKDCTDLGYPTGVAQEYTSAPSTDPDAFCVIAAGNSMVGADIKAGDYLLVEPNRSIEDGDIVLACLEKGKAVKKFFKKKNMIILQPMNPEFDTVALAPDELKKERAVFYRIGKIIKNL